MAGLRGRALVAYLLVCTVWGSTYLAIRIGVQELPPLLFSALRFAGNGIGFCTIVGCGAATASSATRAASMAHTVEAAPFHPNARGMAGVAVPVTAASN